MWGGRADAGEPGYKFRRGRHQIRLESTVSSGLSVTPITLSQKEAPVPEELQHNETPAHWR